MAPVASICRDCLASHVFSVQGNAFSLQTLAYNHGTCWQVLKAQLDRDQSICNLVLTMESVYSFVEAIQSVPDKLEILEEVIVKILKQTVECAIFIREYTGHGFGGNDYKISCDALFINPWIPCTDRVRTQTISKTSHVIKALSKNLLDLKQAFDTGVVVHTAFVSSRTCDKIETLGWLP